MAQGKITQIIGPVVDVEFPPGRLPAIRNALKILRPGGGNGDSGGEIIVEVAQHLGEPSVRAVRLAPTSTCSSAVSSSLPSS